MFVVWLNAYSQSVHRPPPVPSSKTRNRSAHSNNGNMDQQLPSPSVTRRLQKQRGLMQNRQKATKRRIANALAAKNVKRRAAAGVHAAVAAAVPTAVPAAASSAPAKPLIDKPCPRPRRADSDEDNWVPNQRRPQKRRHSVPPRRTVDASAQTAGNTHHDAFEPPSPFVLSHHQLLTMQLRYNLTARQMRGVMATYTRAAPRGVTMHEPNFRDAAVAWNARFLDQFTTIRLQHPTDSSHFRSVFPTEVSDLFRQLAELHAREIRTVHLACDAGRGFLKVVATVEYQRDDDTGDDDLKADSDDHINDHSRLRVIVLAVLPLMSESYELLKDVFHRINFPSSLHFIFIGDLKVLNICLGLSTNAASNPCPFCERQITVAIAPRDQLSAGTPRTFQSISNHAAAYSTAAKPELVDYASCVHPPLEQFRQRPHANIDTVVGHPGLHYLLSANWIVNKLEKLSEPNISAWYHAYHFVRPSYFSGDFEGNQIRFLLRPQQLHDLRDLLAQQQPPTEVPMTKWGGRCHTEVSLTEQYFNLLVAFSRIVRGCFGKRLRDNWEGAIADFRDQLLHLKLRKYPTKFHIITSHVQLWCLRHRAGLATVTDQWAETIHSDWRRLWERSYQVKDVDCDRFASQLHRCVSALNAQHSPYPPAAPSNDDPDS